ncbi:hypothetical protein QQF64_020674 [Cirrhinus molitorella]|uniref:Uncharacterized protein n=1 Tax=Cirrhinus molitorella TaxID=172907 RepID=A0ABR3LD98_9TELE
MGERRASGRSRSRSAAFTQKAGQEDGRRGSGDRDQDPLPNPKQSPSQELPGYIAPLTSDLAVSVSADQPHRKRKRQSGSRERMSVRPPHREDLPNAPAEKRMRRAHCWGEVDSALCMLGSAGLMDCQ